MDNFKTRNKDPLPWSKKFPYIYVEDFFSGSDVRWNPINLLINISDSDRPTLSLDPWSTFLFSCTFGQFHWHKKRSLEIHFGPKINIHFSDGKSRRRNITSVVPNSRDPGLQQSLFYWWQIAALTAVFVSTTTRHNFWNGIGSTFELTTQEQKLPIVNFGFLTNTPGSVICSFHLDHIEKFRPQKWGKYWQHFRWTQTKGCQKFYLYLRFMCERKMLWRAKCCPSITNFHKMKTSITSCPAGKKLKIFLLQENQILPLPPIC